MPWHDRACIDKGLDTTATGASVSDTTERRSSYEAGIAPDAPVQAIHADSVHHGLPTDTFAYDPAASSAAGSETRTTGLAESRPSACMQSPITMSVPTMPYTA